MSRNTYAKTCGRKVGANTIQPTSIQFDKLFCENSNRPSAAKSAGTIGKWGITSFTSIRSSNFSLINRRDESVYGNKRMRGGDLKLPRKDPFILEPRTPPSPTIPPRPKKFFKSRSAFDPAPPPTPLQTTKNYSKPPPARLSVTAASKKAFPPPQNNVQEEQTEAMNLSSTPTVPAKPTTPTTPSANPPIVLRIFKGTSQLITPVVTEEKQPQPPPPPPPQPVQPPRRESRRRCNSSEVSGQISPKRLRDRGKDPVVEEVKPVETRHKEVIIETKDELKIRIRTHPEVKVNPEPQPVPVDIKQELPEVPEMVETVENITKQIEDTKKLQEAEALLASTYVDFKATADKLLDVKQTKSSLDSDREKLLAVLEGEEGQEDLVHKTEEELPHPTLGSPQVPTPADIQQVPAVVPASVQVPVAAPVPASVPVADTVDISEVKHDENDVQQTKETENDWFSDSDGSTDSIAEQINTLADSEEVTGNCANEKVNEEVVTNKVPTKKSIFKSRGVTGGNKKRLALYKHKWCDDKETGQGGTTPTETNAAAASETGAIATEEEFVEEEEPLMRVTTYPEGDPDDENVEAITSVKCTKKAKGFYTVVRNVKKAHQIQESGEFQEFNDDVEYILDALQDNNPIGTRCLSAISLATKCMAPAFRMHVRAHGTVAKFFRALHDATKDQSLGMCTATVMFVLSQDRLNMDLDRDCLELMLNLLESDTSHNSALDDCGLSDVQLRKTRERVRQLCEEIQSKGHAKHLNLDNITVGHLAMETLLSLTSKRAGEWFKEELRELGGLEHIVRTVVECSRVVDDTVTSWTPQLLDRLRKVDRCLRVLENVTLQNEENSMYLLTYGDGVLVDTLVRLYKLCDAEICNYPVYSMADKESTGFVIRECLIANLKVLINLTHDFNNRSFGSTLTGGRQGVIEASLHVLLQAPDHVPEEQKFDLIVLALILLINLVEHSEANRKLIIEAKAPEAPDSIFDGLERKSAVSSLVSLFYQQEELARTEERKTDAILDGEPKPKTQANVPAKSQEEFIEETVAMLLQKAGRHMEHTLVGAYVALLLGYLIIDNKKFEDFVRGHLPEGNFNMMLSVLQKFFNFMTLTAAAGSGSSRGIKATEMVIKHLTERNKTASSSSEGTLLL